MKNILISGSLAYDNIMTFDGDFPEYFLPESMENLSVSFVTSEQERYFGGCAGNIAYSLKLLGTQPYIFAVAGNDFGPYADWLDKNGIPQKYIEISQDLATAGAQILTDRGQRQIAIFSPGAMADMTRCVSLAGVEGMDLVVVAPDTVARMRAVAEECVRLDLPYLFDPGQRVALMDKADLEKFLKNAVGVILNQYELKLMEERLGLGVDEIVKMLPFLIETLGGKGARIYRDGGEKVVSTVEDIDPVDSTGCGDAFRAGFVHGFVNGKSLEECCDLGNKVAGIALKKRGSQNHFDLLVAL